MMKGNIPIKMEVFFQNFQVMRVESAGIWVEEVQIMDISRPLSSNEVIKAGRGLDEDIHGLGMLVNRVIGPGLNRPFDNHHDFDSVLVLHFLDLLRREPNLVHRKGLSVVHVVNVEPNGCLNETISISAMKQRKLESFKPSKGIFRLW